MDYLYLSQKLAEIDDPAKREGIATGDDPWVGGRLGASESLGEYDFSEDRVQDWLELSPQTDRLNQVPSWEFRNRRKSFTHRLLARILWDFTYLCWANPDGVSY
jgi:hypothetical protein